VSIDRSAARLGEMPEAGDESHQLSRVLSEFARTMLTDFPIQKILDRLVDRIVEVLPISGAGVSLISPDTDPRYVAASDEAALRYEVLQSELREGPCIEAYRTGVAVKVPDLSVETRFPTFAPRALEAGLAAVFTFPLRHGIEHLGALDLYRDETGEMDVDTIEAAQTLADVAAAYLLNAQARADLRDSSARARHLALHDSLTGLPNRVVFLERLDQAVRRTSRTGKTVAVLFADLDRFKLVNDLHGHAVGDELLVAVAHRLLVALRASDTVARLAGDEFVMLCEDLADAKDADAVASRVVDGIAKPFVLSGVEVSVSVSVGIAFSRLDDQRAEDVLDDADAAMYQAKRRGGSRYQAIDLSEQHRSRHHDHLEQDLLGAVKRGELRNEYQPIVASDDGRMTGVEALVRWDHPTRGLVSPTNLIPLAEEIGVIAELDRWVLRQACADRRRWQHSGLSDELQLSVNISGQQLMSADLSAIVASVLAETDCDPELLTLEVTESVFVQDSDRALMVMRDLKRLGVHLALDDFGTGYSSLTYLKRFPIDTVKIDQGFIADLGRSSASSAIVQSVIDLAHALGMRAVGEGVETPEQRARLVEFGCDRCQGYLFARPMSADALTVRTQACDARGAVQFPSVVGDSGSAPPTDDGGRRRE
jgi:diguanylate cyclase (GGDEF)-like protein